MSKSNADNNTGKIIRINEIMDYLPHRYPFLLVDRVIDYELGKSICGIKNVTSNEEFFNGHFPTHPVMPGVLIIEALAQVSGLLFFLTTNTGVADTNWFYFAGIDNAKFKRVVYPGDQLHLYSEMVRNKFDIWIFNAKATVDGELACTVDLKIAISVKEGAVKHD